LACDPVGDGLEEARVFRRQTAGHEGVPDHALPVQELKPHASGQVLAGEARVVRVVAEHLTAVARAPAPARMERPPLLGNLRVPIGFGVDGRALRIEPPGGIQAHLLECVANRDHSAPQFAGDRGVRVAQVAVHLVGGKCAVAEEPVVVAIGPGLVNEHFGLRCIPLDVVA
jgi:hypothetical protein